VLVDDLVVKGTNEPYRMFTSRAEYRLSLRSDNADLRLTRLGHDLGLVSDHRYAVLETREALLETAAAQLQAFRLPVSQWSEKLGLGEWGGKASADNGRQKTAAEMLAHPQVTLEAVEAVMGDALGGDGTGRLAPIVRDTAAALCKYADYLVRQEREIEGYHRAADKRIPPGVVYTREAFPPLKTEEIEKLDAARPTTLAEAAAVPGIRPQSIIYLWHHIQRGYYREGGTGKRPRPVQAARDEEKDRRKGLVAGGSSAP